MLLDDDTDIISDVPSSRPRLVDDIDVDARDLEGAIIFGLSQRPAVG